jgi:K+ transporter
MYPPAAGDRTAMMPERQDGVTSPPGRRSLWGLAALGVVYGDIGTSPLYALPRVLPRTARRSR